MRSLGDDGVRAVVEGYVNAWDRGDIDAVVAMLTEDATFAMPPAPSWYQGHAELIAFLGVGPLSGEWRWRHIFVRASGSRPSPSTAGTKPSRPTFRSRSTC